MGRTAACARLDKLNGRREKEGAGRQGIQVNWEYFSINSRVRQLATYRLCLYRPTSSISYIVRGRITILYSSHVDGALIPRHIISEVFVTAGPVPFHVNLVVELVLAGV